MTHLKTAGVMRPWRQIRVMLLWTHPPFADAQGEQKRSRH